MDLNLGNLPCVGALRAHPRLALWYRPLMLGLAVPPLLFGLAVLNVEAQITHGITGADLRVFVELGHRWLATGTIYAPYQLTGPYSAAMTADITQTPGVYPSAIGPLFVPLTLLPFPLTAVLWWAVPWAFLAYALWRWRPAPWTWPLMAIGLGWPQWSIWSGGTSMWIMAAAAAGLLWRWPSALILLKPTFAPLALIGIRDRQWWIAVAVIAAVTLVGPGLDYVAVVANATDSLGVLHSAAETPMVLVPLVGWLGRTEASARAQTA